MWSVSSRNALCNKQDLLMLHWKQDAMWQHLLQSLEQERLNLFPVNSKAISSPEQHATKATATHNLYCICRRRYKQKDTSHVNATQWCVSNSGPGTSCCNSPVHRVTAGMQVRWWIGKVVCIRLVRRWILLTG